MEFYLQLLDLFCRPGDTIYSVFSGTKVLCAGLVSHAPPGFDACSDQYIIFAAQHEMDHLDSS